MPRAGLNRARVVDEAARMADATGYDGLNLSAVADALDVRPPSLYKHVAGLDDLRIGVAELGYRELEQALRTATDTAGRPVVQFARAYRRFALDRPGLASLVIRVPPGYEAVLQPVADAATAPLIAMVRGYGFSRDEDVIHYARFVRSAVHGFVTIEASGGFRLPESIDASFDLLTATLDDVLTERGRR